MVVAALAAFGVASDAAGSGPSSGGANGRRHGKIERIAHPRPDMVRVRAGWFMMGMSDAELRDTVRACMRQLGRSKWYCRYLLIGVADINTVMLAVRNIRAPRQLTNRGDYYRRVYLSPFDIDRYEVTVADYRACAAAGACNISPLVSGDTQYLKARWPMVNVTWDEARTYCRWRGKRLPTEAEWEKAARGTHAWRWTWGNQVRARGANHGKVDSSVVTLTRAYTGPQKLQGGYYSTAPDASDGARYAVPPGTMRWSEGPYGTFDMSGNVSEYVADYWSPNGYKGLPTYNPVRRLPQTGYAHRVIRGGSWMEPKLLTRTYMRSSNRGLPRSEHVGFRCARSAK